ncbi:hypothetical protein SOP94_22815 [Peribacillus frigoritolerans]|uniref:hypothetical protein n=1 Tax=Peribacillus frigoritolerans TaxID=450367 RepID=UPI002B24C23D|nr:hypothetical protein [Peribacillus frigoritolerans]MEB2631270.1 hypothetical protein [Peribacillus frigoritolerans]
MSKHRLFHTLIVVIFFGCFLYGVTTRTPESFTVTIISGIVGIGLLLANHKMNKKSET